jgi:hypothetical protein
MTDHELAIWAFRVAAISAAASVINLLVYIIKEAVVPWFHGRKLLYNAFEQPLWVITSKDRYDLKYAPQDGEEHLTIDLILPSHTPDILIHIILKARASFLRTHADIGFDGDRHKKPVIQYWFHPFVARGLYPLPYVATQADGAAWEEECAFPNAPEAKARQGFFPDGSRSFEEIDRLQIGENGTGNLISAKADVDFYRVLPPSGYTKGLPEHRRTDDGSGENSRIGQCSAAHAAFALRR